MLDTPQKCPCCGQPVSPSRLLVDMASNAFSCGGAMIHAKPQQVEVLDTLLRACPRVVSYDRMIYEIWGNSEPEYAKKVLAVEVCALRKLLAGASVRIETVWNRGYRLVLT